MNNNSNIVILLSPVFFEIALDICIELNFKKNYKFGFFCLGVDNKLHLIHQKLQSKDILFIESLDSFESDLINSIKSENDQIYFINNFIKLIQSDRRLGKGFVNFAKVRAHKFEKIISKYGISKVSSLYAKKLYHKLDYYFEKYSFDCVFLYAIAGFPAYILWDYFESKKLKKITIKPSRVGDLYFLTDNFFGLLDLDQQYNYLDEKKALEFLDNFRQKPVLPSYSKGYNKKLYLINLFKNLSHIIPYILVLTLKKISLNIFFNFYTYVKLKHKLLLIKTLLIKIFIKPYRPDVFNFNEKYVYYPLHVDPEASTMVEAPLYTNQLFVIETLLKTIPDDHYLYIKEHLPMIGFRSTHFYDKLRSLPKVKLIDPEINQFELIKNAQFVSTITGTAGIEGLIHKVPLILFGNTPYEGIEEGIIKAGNLETLKARIDNFKFNNEKLESKLVSYFSVLFSESFELPMDFFWNNKYPQKDEQIIKRIIRPLVKKINEHLD